MDSTIPVSEDVTTRFRAAYVCVPTPSGNRRGSCLHGSLDGKELPGPNGCSHTRWRPHAPRSVYQWLLRSPDTIALSRTECAATLPTRAFEMQSPERPSATRSNEIRPSVSPTLSATKDSVKG